MNLAPFFAKIRLIRNLSTVLSIVVVSTKSGDWSMSRRNKKEELIEATMHIVAEYGLPSFSMRKVTLEVGVSEALIYRHFISKENLFAICFDRVVSRIYKALDTVDLGRLDTPENIEKTASEVWKAYFKALVENPDQAMFFYEYRNYCYEKVWNARMDIMEKYFSRYIKSLHGLLEKYSLYEKVDPSVFWAYTTDATSFFVKRQIRGQLPSGEEEIEKAWQMIWKGVGGFLSI